MFFIRRATSDKLSYVDLPVATVDARSTCSTCRDLASFAFAPVAYM